MQTIRDRLAAVRQRIDTAALQAHRDPGGIRLLAVSKTRPATDLRLAHEAGQQAFGESYLQEALRKQAELADLPLEWHFIGGIQSNKTAAIAEHFQWVHGLCDLRHARRLSRQRPVSMDPLNCCIQVNISGEVTKNGVAPADLRSLAEAVIALPGVRLRGLMALPAPTQDERQQRQSFRQVRRLFDSLRTGGMTLDTLSMGMSDDLEAAVAEGATIVRIGTAVFGPRR